jgi:hypothetical protein
MSRSKVRHVFNIVLIALTLTFAALPVASARPLARTRPAAGPSTVGTVAGWMETLARWLTGVAGPAPAATLTARSTSDPALPSGGTVTLLTGSCIDPDGHPIPCGR